MYAMCESAAVASAAEALAMQAIRIAHTSRLSVLNVMEGRRLNVSMKFANAAIRCRLAQSAARGRIEMEARRVPEGSESAHGKIMNRKGIATQNSRASCRCHGFIAIRVEALVQR
jgi:hypothetical protein